MRQKLLFLTACLLIIMLPVSLFAQIKTVTGFVTAGNNVPVPGATISVKNSTRAIVSDANGKFKLSIPENTILIISAAGYKTQTINTANTTDLQVKLAEDVSRLDEVVVTGLSTSIKRKNLANAVATISAKELDGHLTGADF